MENNFEDTLKPTKQPPSYESEYLARSRAVIAAYWENMPEMWKKLDELEAEYKGK